jgi:hypothetical protein
MLPMAYCAKLLEVSSVESRNYLAAFPPEMRNGVEYWSPNAIIQAFMSRKRVAKELAFEEGGRLPPEKMKPADEKAHWEAQIKKSEYETLIGTLIPEESVTKLYSDKLKEIDSILETLPDILERDAELTAKQYDMMAASINQFRHTLIEAIS